MSALASWIAMLRGSCCSWSKACWSAPRFKNRQTWLRGAGDESGRVLATQALWVGGRGAWDSPGVAQECGVVQGPAAAAVSLVHVRSVLQEEFTGNQGALGNCAVQTEQGMAGGGPPPQPRQAALQWRTRALCSHHRGAGLKMPTVRVHLCPGPRPLLSPRARPAPAVSCPRPLCRPS